MSGYEFRFAKGWSKVMSALIAGSLVLASAQTAFAGHNGGTFRDYRAQNPDVSRHVARKMFNVENRHPEAANFKIQPFPSSNVVLHAPTKISNSTGPRLHNTRPTNHIARNRTTQISSTGSLVRLGNGLDLDLGSNDRNISLGKGLFSEGGTVQISEGGETKTFGAGSMVSAAEYVAVKQALGSGQTVTIDRSGRATGGSVDLEAIATDRAALRASELVVPVNVTTTGDFSRGSDFRLLGDLNNYGTVLAVSSDGSSRSGAIRAADINNFRGATIRSDISSLTLDASGNINNLGTIDGSGAITLSAAGSINNHGTVRATNDLSLQASNINNHGQISSTSGNVNVDGSSLAALNVDNTKGSIQALAGAINIRNAAYNGTFDSTVNGGSFISKDLNVFAGQATANVFAGEITGVVNQTGLATHTSTASGDLNIGTVCLTGDPTFYNTAGDINITSDITVAQNLVLVASRNITTAANVTVQAGDATQGYEINFIAGAAFTPSGGSNSPNLPPLTNNGGVTLSGKSSKSGGSITLGAGSKVLSQATSLVGNTSGNGVLFVAMGKGGVIDASGGTIKSGGSGTGKNGDIYLLAAGTKGDVLKTGVVDSTGGSDISTYGRDGAVGFFTVDIITSDGNPVVYDANGNVTSGNYLTGNNLNKTGNLVVTDTAAAIDIHTSNFLDTDGGSIVLNGQVLVDSGSAELVANGTITSGPLGTYQAATNIFLIGSSIGTAAAPITVGGNDIESFSQKGSNYVKVVSSGGTILNATSTGTLSIDAPNITMLMPNFTQLTAKDVIVNVKNIALISGGINGSNSVSITTDTGNISNTQFSNPNIINTNILTLHSNSGSIGTSAVPFRIPAGLTAIAMKTNSGDIYTNQITGDGLNFTELEATAGSITVTGQAGIALPAVVNAGTGTITITTSSGTIGAGGNITAKNGVTLNNTSASGKITLAKGTTITTTAVDVGAGNISLNVGPASATPVTPPIPNVNLNKTGTGVFTITGSSLSAKSPVNNFNILGTADIIINNGTTKNTNISLGGNVTLNAN